MAPNCPDPPHKPAVAGSDDDDLSFMGGPDRTVMVQVPTELGPYRLTKLLGRGGMGEVWQAFDTNLERDVAVKLMRKELLANEEAVKRFGREARAVARLNHPSIVQVYTFGDQQGVMYFVMELVEGETITQRMKQCGTVPLHESVFMLLQAIEGLSYANARGIIHRDIKPSNLMLTPDFRMKIADFGLAKMIEHDTQMTAAGTTMGSPNYMSPEQARGEEADHRSDIYALGISFYQMLTGQLPFTAEQPITVLLKQIQEPLPEPVSLQALENGRVLDVLKKMTQKDPEQRYQTYGGLAAAISALAPDVRVKGGHVSTTTMQTPEAAGANPGSPSPAPSTAVFGGEKQVQPAAATVGPGEITEPMPRGGLPPPPPPPPGAPVTPEPVQGAFHPDAGSTKTALAAAAVQGVPPMRTTFFIIVAAAGTAALVALGAMFMFQKMQHRRIENRMPELTGRRAARAETMSKILQERAATSPDAQTPSPTVSPVSSPTAGPTVSPAASPTPSAPAPPVAAVQPAPSTESSTQPAPSVVVPSAVGAAPAVYTLTPAPTPFVSSNQQVTLGGVGTQQNTAIALRDAAGTIIATLRAGSSLPYLRLEGTGANARYVVLYQNQQAYLAFHEGQIPVTAGSTTGASARIDAGFTTLVLGTRGAGRNEKNIDVYRDMNINHPMTSLAPGTEVRLIESGTVFHRVQLPNGKEGYIIKGSASPKQ
ncbi:MAG: serine/threonine-protein kinase [Candidatus Sumerlaeaceae bacterium]